MKLRNPDGPKIRINEAPKYWRVGWHSYESMRMDALTRREIMLGRPPPPDSISTGRIYSFGPISFVYAAPFNPLPPQPTVLHRGMMLYNSDGKFVWEVRELMQDHEFEDGEIGPAALVTDGKGKSAWIPAARMPEGLSPGKKRERRMF
jgi:hypothetical protein